MLLFLTSDLAGSRAFYEGVLGFAARSKSASDEL